MASPGSNGGNLCRPRLLRQRVGLCRALDLIEPVCSALLALLDMRTCITNCCRFYIVTYALAIYNLNLLLGFLTPQARRITVLTAVLGQAAAAAPPAAGAASAVSAAAAPAVCAASAVSAAAAPAVGTTSLALLQLPPAAPSAAGGPVVAGLLGRSALLRSGAELRSMPRRCCAALQIDPEADAPVLPSKHDEEFRPFVRR